jgi:hypothetical protein
MGKSSVSMGHFQEQTVTVYQRVQCFITWGFSPHIYGKIAPTNTYNISRYITSLIFMVIN